MDIGRIQLQLPSSPPASAECCHVRCGCFSCNCYPCCSCSCCRLIVAILMIFFGVTAALLWYTNVFPDVSKDLNSISNENMAHAGWVICGVLGFVAICCILCGIYIRRRSRIDNLAESEKRLTDADVEIKALIPLSTLQLQIHVLPCPRPVLHS